MPLYVVRKGYDMPVADACVVPVKQHRWLKCLTSMVRRMVGDSSRTTVENVEGKPWRHEICLDAPGFLKNPPTAQQLSAVCAQVLQKAAENGFGSVMIPLQTAVPDGLVDETMLHAATAAIRSFLDSHEEMIVWLMLPSGVALQQDGERSADLRRYLEENLCPEKMAERGSGHSAEPGAQADLLIHRGQNIRQEIESNEARLAEAHEMLEDVHLQLRRSPMYAQAMGLWPSGEIGDAGRICIRPDPLQEEIRLCEERICRWEEYCQTLSSAPDTREHYETFLAAQCVMRSEEETLRVLRKMTAEDECFSGMSADGASGSCGDMDHPAESAGETQYQRLERRIEQSIESINQFRERLRDSERELSFKQRQLAIIEGELLGLEQALYCKSEVQCRGERRPASLSYGAMSDEVDEMLKNLDENFRDMLLRLIREQEITNKECYVRANVTRQEFSKICRNENYLPKKPMVAAFCIGLKLDWEKSMALLAKAGHGMSRSSEFDVIFRYCIDRKVYDVDVVNRLLHEHNQPLLGSGFRDAA